MLPFNVGHVVPLPTRQASNTTEPIAVNRESASDATLLSLPIEPYDLRADTQHGESVRGVAMRGGG
jgi:hypothetical protein